MTKQYSRNQQAKSNRILPLLQIMLTVFVVLTLLSGCSRGEPNAPGTPNVTQDQAKIVAQEVYGVTEIEAINLRLLTEDELKLRSDEQSQLTPIYYVINAVLDEEQVTVYVSSNEENHHFIVKKEG